MTEAAAIARTLQHHPGRPVTREQIETDLRSLGLNAGMNVMVHTALSRMGWVCGGADTVIAALCHVIAPGGTLVMSAQSPELGDPSHWCSPPVPKDWWPIIRAEQPAFDPSRTPTGRCGVMTETFRRWPGTQRSLHPLLSLAAKGPLASTLLRHQPLDDPLGNDSPLAVLEGLDGWVLMLGTDWDTCTALHLAERRADPDAPRLKDGAPVMIAGKRQWLGFDLPVMDSDRFLPLGPILDSAPFMRCGTVGAAFARLFPLAPASLIAEKALRRGNPEKNREQGL